ncbi:MAG: response regulator [Verrucomicrobiia bacterium]|jgi:CheY-like chemotaxis protein
MTQVSESFIEGMVDTYRQPPTGQYDKPSGKLVYRNEFTVLVVDDDASFLHLVSSVLRKHGYNVLNASSGVKGLTMLTYAPSDIRLVLLDYTMPNLNGDETLRHLRKLNPSIKVVAVTSSNPNQVAASFRDGVDKFLKKPLDARELIATIDSLVGSRPKE